MVINTTSGRTLAVTTTDANGKYYAAFYSTATQFKVTTSYIGCTSITNTVNVSLNSTDNIYYGTSNFQMTPLTATYSEIGDYGTNVWVHGDNMYGWAGQLSVTVNGKTYTAYCIDIYTMISTGNTLLVNGPLPGTTANFNSFLLNSVDWGKVNYIINNYNPNLNSTYQRNTEAAAIQCAIWYFTSAPYGKYPGGNDPNHTSYYQFLTYNSSYGTPYDGLAQNSGSTAVITRAWQMINSAISMKYPASINVTPTFTRVKNGDSTTVTATVYDNNGDPLPNVTVNFTIPTGSGTLSVTQGLTNAAGQISTILSGVTGSTTANVLASVTGNYGNLLYDDQYNAANKLQNLVAINLLPNVVSATSVINYDVQADVQLTQTATSPVNVGDLVSYIVTAHNIGPSTATGILISDIIPSGLTNVIITPSSGTTYSNGVWTIPSLANLASATLTITGNAGSIMAGTSTTNTATRTAEDQYNGQPETSTATVYTKNAVLNITNTANNSNLNVGDSGKFTVTVTNNGPDAASNIQISDILPSGYTASYNAGSYSNNIWTINSLASGSSATLTFTGTITPSMAGKTTTNHATATWTEYPKTITITDATIYVKDAEVALSQTTSATTVNVGDSVTYTVKATNNGPDTATNINISDSIPSGLTNVVVTPSIGTYNNGIWTIPSLTNGQTATLTITGTATATMAGTSTTNTATRIGQTEYNGQSAASTSAPVYTKKADVKLSQTSTSPVNVGDVVNYVVNAVNNGPDTASNVHINNLLPSQLIGVIAVPSVGTFNNNIWTIPTLASGQTATLTITGSASSSMAGTYTTNTATRLSQTEYNSQPTTTSASVYTKVVSLDITNTANNGRLNVGDTGKFTVTVTNNGPDDATNININDLLPSGYSATTTAGNYDGTTWTINSLASGSSATLTFTGTITPSMAGETTTNHATATWTEYPKTITITDATIYVKDAEVALSQTTSATTVNVGDSITYTVKATNNGPDTATNILINDIIPSGLTNVVVTPSVGSYSNGIWTIPSLASGVEATLTITGNAGSTMAGTNTANTATRTSQTEYNSQPTVTNASVYTNQANLIISNTGTTPVNVGDIAKFTVTITNNGPDTATNIDIKDITPNGFTASTTTGNYNGTDWTINSLTSGATATLTFTKTITASMAGTSTVNHATAVWSEYPKSVTISDASIYTKLANVSITQTGNYSSNNVTFIVTATNNGPDNATNIIINDAIPSGLTNVSVNYSVGSYSNGVWTIPSLTNGTIATLNITGTAVPQSNHC